MFRNNSVIFKDLFVLDLANNHFGNLSHAKKIIKNFSKIRKKYKFRSTIKFQFRDLPNFVHKNFRNSNERYIRRFLDTKLSDNDFFKLFKFIKQNKFLTSCTPFDESSVDKIEKFGFDIIKIASVSALDFNLHERVVLNKIPKIISTGGLDLGEIDKIVSFYTKKKQTFAIMHCVSVYPSDNSTLNLKFIKNLKDRYPGVTIGWSTHEYPEEFLPSVVARSYGASIFEKHIGINSKKFKLNKYSITPDLFEKWYLNLQKSIVMSGLEQKKIYDAEKSTIKSLSRGVYLKKDIKKNEIVTKKDIFFATPLQPKQLSSIEFKRGIKTKLNVKKDKPLMKNQVTFNQKIENISLVNSYLHKAKAMLNYSKIPVSEKFDLEISHHKGIKNFDKYGCFLFNIINREYCKKLLVMLPNQKHPSHFHKKKFESFSILSGNLTLTDNKNKYNLRPGDIFHLKKNSWHHFRSGKKGCIFEEISTTSYKDDSFYKNKKIKKLSRDQRKTYINSWFHLEGIDVV